MISASIDKADMQRPFDGIKRAEKELGKSNKDALSWAAFSVMSSLGASCKISAKRRKIVDNPDKTYLTDSRKAPLGVMKYKKGKQIFSPIRGGGEYGQSIKYLDRGGVLLKVGGLWKRFTNAEIKELSEKDIRLKNHPKTYIKRSGLAKRSWTKLGKYLRSGGVLREGRINASAVRWSLGDSQIEIRNRLGYIVDAMYGGLGAVNNAMIDGAKQLEKRIDWHLKKLGLTS
jgi:hypothetical protein